MTRPIFSTMPANNFIDLTGRTFGRLVVLSKVGVAKNGNALWLCRCSCPDATEKVVRADALKAGQVSCGCWAREDSRRRMTSVLPIDPSTGLCDHPECTGIHGRLEAPLCPASIARDTRSKAALDAARLSAGLCLRCEEAREPSLRFCARHHELMLTSQRIRCREVAMQEKREQIALLEEQLKGVA